jgi:hypothetical protein
MAKEIARRKKVRQARSDDVAMAKAGSASRTLRKRAAKPTTRKQSKKAAKHRSDSVGRTRPVYAADHGLMTAFHHMQRASVVMSLMEKGTGRDLRGLLKRGVELYRKAVEDDAKNNFVLRAIGVLRATEHLSKLACMRRERSIDRR